MSSLENEASISDVLNILYDRCSNLQGIALEKHEQIFDSNSHKSSMLNFIHAIEEDIIKLFKDAQFIDREIQQQYAGHYNKNRLKSTISLFINDGIDHIFDKFNIDKEITRKYILDNISLSVFIKIKNSSTKFGNPDQEDWLNAKFFQHSDFVSTKILFQNLIYNESVNDPDAKKSITETYVFGDKLDFIKQKIFYSNSYNFYLYDSPNDSYRLYPVSAYDYLKHIAGEDLNLLCLRPDYGTCTSSQRLEQKAYEEFYQLGEDISSKPYNISRMFEGEFKDRHALLLTSESADSALLPLVKSENSLKIHRQKM